MNQISNSLWQENPLTAKALGLLNRKLSIIAAHQLTAEGQQDLQSYEQLMVNISGCGIAFDSVEKLTKNTRLLLNLQLKPSNTEIKLTGTVVKLEARRPGAKKPFWVRVQFNEENSEHQELLIQHIVQKQSAYIGNRRFMTQNQDGEQK